MSDENALTVPGSSAVSFMAKQKDAIARNSLVGSQMEESTGIKASRFFPFVQLLQRTSNALDQGHNPGTFLFRRSGQDKNPVNLGSSFPAYVCSIRGKAIYYDKENNMVFAEYETVIDGVRTKSPGYDEFVAAAKSCASELNPAYRNGLDVLLWIPALKTFATYFANTVSSVSAVEQMVSPYLGCPVRFQSEQKKNTKGSWYTPACIDTDEDMEAIPTEAEFDAALVMFNQPPARREEADGGDVEGAKKIEGARKRVR